MSLQFEHSLRARDKMLEVRESIATSKLKAIYQIMTLATSIPPGSTAATASSNGVPSSRVPKCAVLQGHAGFLDSLVALQATLGGIMDARHVSLWILDRDANRVWSSTSSSEVTTMDLLNAGEMGQCVRSLKLVEPPHEAFDAEGEIQFDATVATSAASRAYYFPLIVNTDTTGDAGRDLLAVLELTPNSSFMHATAQGFLLSICPAICLTLQCRMSCVGMEGQLQKEVNRLAEEVWETSQKAENNSHACTALRQQWMHFEHFAAASAVADVGTSDVEGSLSKQLQRMAQSVKTSFGAQLCFVFVQSSSFAAAFPGAVVEPPPLLATTAPFSSSLSPSSQPAVNGNAHERHTVFTHDGQGLDDHELLGALVALMQVLASSVVCTPLVINDVDASSLHATLLRGGGEPSTTSKYTASAAPAAVVRNLCCHSSRQDGVFVSLVVCNRDQDFGTMDSEYAAVCQQYLSNTIHWHLKTHREYELADENDRLEQNVATLRAQIAGIEKHHSKLLLKEIAKRQQRQQESRYDGDGSPATVATAPRLKSMISGVSPGVKPNTMDILGTSARETDSNSSSIQGMAGTLCAVVEDNYKHQLFVVDQRQTDMENVATHTCKCATLQELDTCVSHSPQVQDFLSVHFAVLVFFNLKDQTVWKSDSLGPAGPKSTRANWGSDGVDDDAVGSRRCTQKLHPSTWQVIEDNFVSQRESRQSVSMNSLQLPKSSELVQFLKSSSTFESGPSVSMWPVHFDRSAENLAVLIVKPSNLFVVPATSTAENERRGILSHKWVVNLLNAALVRLEHVTNRMLNMSEAASASASRYIEKTKIVVREIEVERARAVERLEQERLLSLSLLSKEGLIELQTGKLPGVAATTLQQLLQCQRAVLRKATHADVHGTPAARTPNATTTSTGHVTLPGTEGSSSTTIAYPLFDFGGRVIGFLDTIAVLKTQTSALSGEEDDGVGDLMRGATSDFVTHMVSAAVACARNREDFAQYVQESISKIEAESYNSQQDLSLRLDADRVASECHLESTCYRHLLRLAEVVSGATSVYELVESVCCFQAPSHDSDGEGVDKELGPVAQHRLFVSEENGGGLWTLEASHNEHGQNLFHKVYAGRDGKVAAAALMTALNSNKISFTTDVDGNAPVGMISTDFKLKKTRPNYQPRIAHLPFSTETVSGVLEILYTCESIHLAKANILTSFTAIVASAVRRMCTLQAVDVRAKSLEVELVTFRQDQQAASLWEQKVRQEMEEDKTLWKSFVPSVLSHTTLDGLHEDAERVAAFLGTSYSLVPPPSYPL
jgi:hypothetical protein